MTTIRSAKALIIHINKRGDIMGYIYKITNKINNKCYIGQTVKNYQERFRQHQLNYTKDYFSQIVLYQAFKKYGIENFLFEVLEEIDKEKLDEREKYWISYYDSYRNGYNSTLGGRLVELYNWDEDDIIQKYYELKSARKVAKLIGCDHSSIDKILNRNNVKRFTQGEIIGNGRVKIVSPTITQSFTDVKECSQWLINNHYTKTNNLNNVSHYLRECIRKEKKYCGFNVYYESKIQSAPLVTME